MGVRRPPHPQFSVLFVLEVLVLAEDGVSRLLLLLYEGVSSPERMKTFLDEMVKAVNATGAIFREHTFSTAGDFHIETTDLSETTGYSPESLSAYVDHYWEIDIYLQRALERFRAADCGVSQLLTTKAELQQHEFYSDYLRRFDVGPMMWGKIDERADYHASISVVRPSQAGHFGEAELKLLTTLAPHLRQALGLSRSLRGLQASNAMLSRGLDEIGIAICMARQDGTILHSTEEAERLFKKKGSGVTLHEGRLKVSEHDEQKVLDSLITGACRTGANRGLASAVRVKSRAAGHRAIQSWTAQSGGALLIKRKSPLRPLQVVVSPFCSGSFMNEPQATALIQFSDPLSIPKSRASVLRALYHLTPVESRMADLLLKGFAVREAASHLGTTLETARFYLKQVQAKTGARRQTELMRLMLSLPGC